MFHIAMVVLASLIAPVVANSATEFQFSLSKNVQSRLPLFNSYFPNKYLNETRGGAEVDNGSKYHFIKCTFPHSQ